jgi:probable biosynthetic protein (TIGR04098 family)
LKEYLHIIQIIVPSFEEEQLDVPIKETAIDSLDMVVIRVEIEKYFGFRISDSKWFQFKTLGKALTYFDEKRGTAEKVIFETRDITSRREEEIRMPQMANSALSENWLLKEIGDIHWELLSKGLEQKSSEFKGNIGNRLYATFVRINYSLSSLNLFRENEILHLKAEIKRYGNNTYYSTVNGQCNEKAINANVMTSFSQRELNDNSKISKTNPHENVNYIEELKNAPEFLNEYRLIKKGLIDEIASTKFKFKITDNVIAASQYSINPYYEINGVGLLYFASYPIIADKCLLDFLHQNEEIKNFESVYYTVYRDIFYFANCNSSERIVFQLNSLVYLDENNIAITSSLYRQSDNILMAKIFTIKQESS